jgi:putative oxidoreductase
MVGAVATHLFIIGGSAAPALVLMLITAAVAWYRRPDSLR